MKSMPLLPLSLVVLALLAPGAIADIEADRSHLHQLLRNFLAGTGEKTVHEAFWAEDLIYTSSAGARFGKAQILGGFDDRSNTATMSLSYGAEDVSIRVLDDIAVITFRLTADQDGVRDSEYFNTGVFRRHGDSWRAFTWQATRIPDA